MTDGSGEAFLAGIRVIELSGEMGEYCGRLLAGLGAEVIKIEPPQGEVTRRVGPFLNDSSDIEESLHFWQFNLGKKSVVLDLESASDRAAFHVLLKTADVFVNARQADYGVDGDLRWDSLQALNSRLISARITPFGDDGPWADFHGSDLIHLALGGVMMNCGYDPEPGGNYDTPPVAPQAYHAYQITGEQLAIAIVTALNYRIESGAGQELSISVHEAVSKSTETDLPDWVYQRQAHYRLTGRHSTPNIGVTALAATKDGRWLLPYGTYLPGGANAWQPTLALLRRYGQELDLGDSRYEDPKYLALPEVRFHVSSVISQFISRFRFNRDIWQEAQDLGLAWAPLRRPEENLQDPHWKARGTISVIHHPRIGRSFPYVTSKWVCAEAPWQAASRPPFLGEHTSQVLVSLRPRIPSAAASDRTPSAQLSVHGKPYALAGVRVLDLGWILASAGAGRFLAGHGAEVIKIEHLSRPDPMRFGPAAAPLGGRSERDSATSALFPERAGPNRSGAFMEINAGKLSLSLNLKSEAGKEILRELVAESDILLEGYSPHAFERMGFGYEELKRINPGIIYVQQSGMGWHGVYRDIRMYGPSAQGISGISEMSGLPEPYPPAGIGYSYLDWFGAYNLAIAMTSALYRRRMTGLGCHIDAAQVEVGLFLNGLTVLDFAANGRRWRRTGNRSPYQRAAPHGAYPAAGRDRWIAIACFSQREWQSLIGVLDRPEWATDKRFATLASRLAHQDELDEELASSTARWDPYDLMISLQKAAIPAGVCQTAEDRYEHDPQLRHLNWLVELDQTEIGRWPVKELPTKFSCTPSYIGGKINRSGPNYGEDTEYVLHTILGRSLADIAGLREQGVL